MTDNIQPKDDLLIWRYIGLVILSIRFIQGFIFWGGGSRRFIYAPSKLDPHASSWMANKLQSAMPGALLGMNYIVSFLLQHFVLLYIAIILFSLAELLSGLALMLGLFTRVAGLLTAFLSIALMLIFGWQGGTCVDEWTMAVANLAMGLTLSISGAGIYSIDSVLLRQHPQLLHRQWFLYSASGPWPYKILKRISIVFALFAIFFTLTTYNYYRGAIFSSYHPGPVSPVQHHLTLADGYFNQDGAIRFSIYVDAGTPALPSHIIRAELIDQRGNIIENWTAEQLSLISTNAIHNDYAYNQFKVSAYGLFAPVGAKAQISLPPAQANLRLDAADYQLIIFTINGHRYQMNLSPSKLPLTTKVENNGRHHLVIGWVKIAV